MPLIFNKKIIDEIHFCVWHITETLDEIAKIAGFDLTSDNFPETISHDQKKIEYLVGQILSEKACVINNIKFSGIYKDEHGKPFLKDSNWQMSISHTVDYVGVVLRKNHPLGLDIEKPRKQILKILPRLFTEKEIAFVNNDLVNATIYWSAKEALYKLYGKRKVDFRENLELFWRNQKLFGSIVMPDFDSKFQIHVEELDPYLVTIAY